MDKPFWAIICKNEDQTFSEEPTFDVKEFAKNQFGFNLSDSM
jgi:hypothetical protein